jgi:Flp pilus assembly protein TadD
MSIIHDALKKAQEERKNKKQDVPYNPLSTQKKPGAKVYMIIAACVVAGVVIAYLYVPHYQKMKQVAQPVVVPISPPERPVLVVANVPTKQQQEQKIAAVPDSEKIPSATPLAKGVSGNEMASPLQNSAKEKKAVDFRASPKKQGRDTEATPFRSPSIKQSKGDVQETSVEQQGIVIRKTEDHAVNSMHNEALKELQSGRIKEAKDIYKQILAKKPNHTEALNNLGVIAMEEDNRAEALFYFKRILEYQKNYPKVYNNIGLIAMKDGDGRLAEEYFRKAISMEPDSVEPYLNLAALLRSGGRFQEAAKLLDVPIRKKIKDPALFLSYAVIKDNLGEYEDAARHYRQYLSSIKNPGSRKDIIERVKYIEEKR